MNIIGLIGGLSWESTALYYRIINTNIHKALGGLHSGRIVLYSFDFDEIAALQKAGAWQTATEKMVESGKSLKAAGATALAICANTMHLMADEVEEATQLPLIHIADSAAQEIKERGLHAVGLLGTAFTMEQPFYRRRLEKAGITVIVPEKEDRAIVHDVIYNELCKGIISPDSRRQYAEVMERLRAKGAQGIVLGCTEIGLLVTDKDSALPLFDTALIHASSISDYLLEKA